MRSTIRIGSVGPDVATWQEFIKLHPVDGSFGPQTDFFTRAWQHAVGLEDDGVVGPGTWAKAEELGLEAAREPVATEIPFVQAKNGYFDGKNRPRWVVIHDMEYPEAPTGAEWCADFFAGRNGMTAPRASAHYCVDCNTIVQCVKNEDGGWHTPGALAGFEVNRSSIGIEHAGYARQSAAEWRDVYSTSMLELSAQLVAKLCVEYEINPVRLTVEELRAGKDGIAGHVDFTHATGKGSHTDPGPGFPWDWYLERVRANIVTVSAPPPALVEANNRGWVRVECNGASWWVAPYYVPFVGIGQAEEIAKSLGCELPSPELVDAIWKAADCKIDGAKMVISDHDGTPQTMASQATFNRVADRLEGLMAGRSLGVDFKLLAGAFKDVVLNDGVLGIYGMHRANGAPIQPFFSGHARGWKDYSQGLRLCKRA